MLDPETAVPEGIRPQKHHGNRPACFTVVRQAHCPTTQQARLRQVPEVDQLSPAWAPHALVLERPDSALELLLIVTGHADATEAQVLAHLQAGRMV